MVRHGRSSLFLAVFFVFVSDPAFGAEGLDQRVAEIEGRVEQLQRRVATLPTSVQTHGSDGAALFLFGAFCALWAQNTNRNPWLWFFLGLIFNVITVLVLLAKNSEDLRLRQQKPDKDIFQD